MQPFALTSAGSPPITTMCLTPASSPRAFSTSSSNGAATIIATASVTAATWTISARENSGEVGTITPPILSTAKFATSAGGMDGARSRTRSSSSTPRLRRAFPSLLTEAWSAL